VNHGGATVADATVTFHPKDPNGRAAFGMTDASGQATLTTFPDTPGDGVLPGEYTVTVEKTAGASGGGADEGEESDEADTETQVKHLLPEKYATVDASDLSATVSENTRDFTFELTD